MARSTVAKTSVANSAPKPGQRSSYHATPASKSWAAPVLQRRVSVTGRRGDGRRRPTTPGQIHRGWHPAGRSVRWPTQPRRLPGCRMARRPRPTDHGRAATALHARVSVLAPEVLRCSHFDSTPARGRQPARPTTRPGAHDPVQSTPSVYPLGGRFRTAVPHVSDTRPSIRTTRDPRFPGQRRFLLVDVKGLEERLRDGPS